MTRQRSYDAPCIACDCSLDSHDRRVWLEHSATGCVVGVSAISMSLSRENMWPHGVRTRDDMERFARLIVGPTVSVEDASKAKLPEDCDDVFLLVSRGGCEQGTCLAELANSVPDMMEELTQHARAGGNMVKPEVAYRTGSEGGEHWYDSAQLSKSHCNCKINFGGQGQSKTRRFLNPDCQQWPTGQRFESVLLDALHQNSQANEVGQNVYMRKAFHALLNRYIHSESHRMGWHADEGVGSYVATDPITGFSFGATGVILIKSKDTSNTAVKVLVVRPGDVYIMGGLFQQKLEHAVPPLCEWPQILDRHGAELLPLEIKAMEDEMFGDNRMGVRYHINLRWHTKHNNCTATWMPIAAADTTRQPTAVKTVCRKRVRPTCAPPHTKMKAEAAIDVKKEDDDDDAKKEDVAVQTEEGGRMEHVRQFVNDCTVVMADCFSKVHLLSTMLRMIHLAASDMPSDIRGLAQCDTFLKHMQSNLQRYEGVLDKLDAEGRTGYDGVIQKATSTVHGMQSVLADKRCLQGAFDRLKPYCCRILEDRAGSRDLRIKNQNWLRKFTITHADCETLMKQIDIQVLAKDGDIVWQMPREWRFTMTQPDGQQKDRIISQNESLYVGFFDVGLKVLSEGAVHRLHMRADVNKAEARQSGEALALVLQDVIRRCTAHVRLLDYDHTGYDQMSTVPAHAYSMHVWAGPHDQRKRHLDRKLSGDSQKRAPSGSGTSSSCKRRRPNSKASQDAWS